MRASEVVKRQSTRIASRLRCCCHAPTYRRRALWSGIRRFKHCRASAPISISAISIQLPATRLDRVAKTWECSGPPTVRRCAALRQVQIPRTARLGGGCSKPAPYWIPGGLPLDPPAASDAGYAAAFVPARLNPFLHAAPAHPLHRRTANLENPDNLFVLYGSAPLPLIAQQQNSGVGLPVCCRPATGH